MKNIFAVLFCLLSSMSGFGATITVDYSQGKTNLAIESGEIKMLSASDTTKSTVPYVLRSADIVLSGPLADPLLAGQTFDLIIDYNNKNGQWGWSVFRINLGITAYQKLTAFSEFRSADLFDSMEFQIKSVDENRSIPISIPANKVAEFKNRYAATRSTISVYNMNMFCAKNIIGDLCRIFGVPHNNYYYGTLTATYQPPVFPNDTSRTISVVDSITISTSTDLEWQYRFLRAEAGGFSVKYDIALEPGLTLNRTLVVDGSNQSVKPGTYYSSSGGLIWNLLSADEFIAAVGGIAKAGINAGSTPVGTLNVTVAYL